MNGFSNVTKDYLYRFYCILDDMILGMTEAELTNSVSHNFIVQMIPHHMAAIEMSQNILQYTTFIPLQNIASDIIKEQTQSISDMEAALCSCSAMQNTDIELSLYQHRYKQITEKMFSQMRNAPSTNDINADFMREMIPHHEGAIQMSENTLRFPICPELNPILHAIITSQRNGIRKMIRLLRCCCQCRQNSC